MSTRSVSIRLRRAAHRSRLLQVGILIAFWAAGEALVRLTGLPLPGSIVALAAVLVLLARRRLCVSSVRRGANWLLAEMLLFFVPAVLAVLEHREFLGLLGLKVLAVILVGTLSVMAVTALTVELGYRWRMRHERAAVLA
ncbi:CidA/LrgA family protein [Oceanicella sp. SM1341]|uniref:CidA/LrgA family protein n=1 Tax=Oceanicella sp. SM1341 TaxID=1548889 RepID=UPI000E55760F|nr:CidA/LrgA family protein [Oceanicella sp. SM1341]